MLNLIFDMNNFHHWMIIYAQNKFIEIKLPMLQSYLLSIFPNEWVPYGDTFIYHTFCGYKSGSRLLNTIHRCDFQFLYIMICDSRTYFDLSKF